MRVSSVATMIYRRFERKYRVELKHTPYEKKEVDVTPLPNKYIQVLDKGYIGLVNCFGTELDIVNAARVSYDKKSEEFNDNDKKLLQFLLREGHTSPLRHVSLSFECYVPLMVARQHWKYAVASTFVDDQNGWNESSRRYITEEPVFHVPDVWRSAPENSKQGSGPPLDELSSRFFSESLVKFIEMGEQMYNLAIGQGVAPEQARLFLPAYGMYVRYHWTISLAGLLNFLDQRLGHDAQSEIHELAGGALLLTAPQFPTVFEWRYNEGVH